MKIVKLSCVAFAMGAALSSFAAPRTGPWTKEQAWEWYNAQPWIRGCNYMPASAANRYDMWQVWDSERRFEEMERELLEYRRTLDERERALKPELTVRDIASADKRSDESAIGAKLLDENDLSLPRESRALARAKRVSAEAEDALLASMRTNAVERLERLYVSALAEDRVVDAEFYKSQIKAMYPDWKFTKKEKEEK